MDIAGFRASLRDPSPPPGLTPALVAMWHDAHDEWDRAHDQLQADDGEDTSWVHAYLHRKEGDLGNARYWYRRARKACPTSPLEQEWEQIVSALLAGGEASWDRGA